MTKSVGGSAYVSFTSTLNWNGGSCTNNFAIWGACWTIDMNSIMTLADTDVYNAHAVAGSVVFLNHMSEFIGTNLRVKDSYADGQGGCFYAYGSCSTTCTNCTLTHCYSPRGFGGLAVVQSFSSLYLYGTLVLDAQAVNSIAGAVLATGNAVVVIDKGTVIRNAIGQLGGAFKNEGQSTVSVLGTVHGGAYYGASGGALILNNALLIGNTAGANGAAILAVAGEQITMTNNTQILNNRAENFGGAFYLSGGATFTIQGPAVISGNQAAASGGAFYYDNEAVISLSGPEIQMTKNLAPIGSLGSIFALPGQTIIRPPEFDGSHINGTIFIQYTQSSQVFMDSHTFLGWPNVKLMGRASSLGFANLEYFNATTINFVSYLPTFSVFATDFFGNPVEANLWNPVIVKISEISQNATVDGEILKAILDEKNNQVTFSGLRIPQPGQYVLQANGFFTSLDLAEGGTWPTFYLNVITCDERKEMLYPVSNVCVPIRNTASSVRVGIGAAAIVGILFVGLNMVGLMKYQTLKLIRSNSVMFLFLSCLGCCLCLVSLVVQMSTFTLSCKAAAVLDNVGFALIFGSLCVKSVRIQVLFDEKRSQKSKMNIAVFVSDSVLTGYVAIGCILMVVFIIGWFMVLPPTTIDVITGDQAVTERCNLASTFGILITAIRIVVIFFAAFMAFQIRNVPSVYNESKFLGFTTYNWFLFSALLNALVEFAIVDSNTSFVVAGIAILVPTIMTVALLVTAKLWVCVFDPDGARMISFEGTSDRENTGGPSTSHQKQSATA
ncbi:UNVERIFIED_CONTAM: hypothetical protein HDU68_006072 [Siphonaria sp. JEL0065]|nr:hypothetical protein HDU68_006072 [Siphonaria sp. JEL0065]